MLPSVFQSRPSGHLYPTFGFSLPFVFKEVIILGFVECYLLALELEVADLIHIEIGEFRVGGGVHIKKPEHGTELPLELVDSGLVEAFGFALTRVSGSHHIFTHPDVAELVNLQEVGGQAKPYQIRQFLKLVEEYNIILEDDEP